MVRIPGQVLEVCKAGAFRVQVSMGENKNEIVCHLSGKMRMNSIKIVAGDNVDVEMSPYDLSKGRIVYRSK